MRLARDMSRVQPAGPDHLWKSLWAVLGSEAGMRGAQSGSPGLPSPAQEAPGLWLLGAERRVAGGYPVLLGSALAIEERLWLWCPVSSS